MSLMSPAQWLLDFFRGGSEKDGVRVTERSSSTYPPAWYALNKISSDFAKLPVSPMRYLERGAEADYGHQSYYVLRKRPNPNQTPFAFKQTLVGHAIMYGNGRALIVRGGGRVNELVLLNPRNTRTFLVNGEKWHVCKPDADDRVSVFRTPEKADGTEYVFIPDRDVLHLPAFSYDGIEGLGLLDIGREVFSTGLNSQRTTNRQIIGGFNGKLMLEAPTGAFSDEATAQRFITLFNEFHSSPDNAGRAGLLRNGIKATVLNMSNKDAEFAETKKFSRQDIAMMFGLESIMGDESADAYASLEHRNISYLQGALMQWLVKFEEEANEKLLTEREKRLDTHYFKFNTAALLRGDFASTTTALVSLVGATIISPNEAREKLDMNPYEGGDEFKNPNTTSPDRMTTDSSGDDSNDMDEDEQIAEEATANAPRLLMAIRERFATLLHTERERLQDCCKKKNFVRSAESFYAGWKDRLAEVALGFGSGSTATDRYCDEGLRLVIDASGAATAETLKAEIAQLTATWDSRIQNLAKEIFDV